MYVGEKMLTLRKMLRLRGYMQVHKVYDSDNELKIHLDFQDIAKNSVLMSLLKYGRMVAMNRMALAANSANRAGA